MHECTRPGRPEGMRWVAPRPTKVRKAPEPGAGSRRYSEQGAHAGGQRHRERAPEGRRAARRAHRRAAGARRERAQQREEHAATVAATPRRSAPPAAPGGRRRAAARRRRRSVAAEASAAWIGRARERSEMPSSSRACAPSASWAISCSATCARARLEAAAHVDRRQLALLGLGLGSQLGALARRGRPARCRPAS